MDLFLPGWQVPPGTWPYSIQDLLQAAFPSAAPSSGAGIQSFSSSAGPPSGGLLGVLAKPGADWNRGFGSSDPPASSASGGLFSSLSRPNIGWGSRTPYWLQTAMPFGLGPGQPPWNDPRPQAMSQPTWEASASPDLSTRPPNADPSAPFWLHTVLPFQADGSGLPLSVHSGNASPEVQPQQSPVTTWDLLALPMPAALASIFPPVPPNLSWNDGLGLLPQMPVGPNIEPAGRYAPTQLDADSARNILELWSNPADSEDANRLYGGMASISPQPDSAAEGSLVERVGPSQIWPVLPSGYRVDEQSTNKSSSAAGDPRVISDATPHNEWNPGARYAAKSRRGQRGIEPEPGQAARLVEAQARADRAIGQVREFEPNWRPRPSLYEGVEGRIRAYESEAEQAQARLREIARLNFLSTIPRERPPTTKERNDVAREIARWLAKNHNQVIEGVSWLLELEPSIQAYLDEPKSLEELQRAVSYPGQGSDIHHIVEKSSAEDDGFPKWMIHAPENLVRIPRFKHWEINAWYQRRNERYEGLSPREYLRGKDWTKRMDIGLKALIEHGVLKP